MRARLILLLVAIYSVVALAQGPAAPTNVRVIAALNANVSTPCTDAQTLGNAVYVRQAASGSGTGADWTNALTTPPTTLVRGKTYCIADTTTGFGQWKITAHTASTTVWTNIVHATVADHGTSTGWLNSYGDGQAIFSSSASSEGTFDYAVNGSGYVRVSGNGTAATCGAIPALKDSTPLDGSSQTGCGLKFISTADTGQAFNWHATGTNFIAEYVELQGNGGTTTAEYTLTADQQGYAFWGDPTVVTLSRSFIHNTVTMAGSTSDMIFEGNFFANNRINSTDPTHGNVVYHGFRASNVHFRYNYVNNYNAEGFFVTFCCNAPPAPSNTYVYSNVFQAPLGIGTAEYARGFEIREGSATAYSNIQVLGNTFYGLEGGGISDRANESGAGCTGCAATNNVSVSASNGCNGVTGGTGCSFTYTTNTDDSTTSRFVSVSNSDFHLTGALAGTSLASTYNKDILGNTRGADGTWDRGAYEYCSGGCGTLSMLPSPFEPILASIKRQAVLPTELR